MPRYNLSDINAKISAQEKLVSIALYGKNMAELADEIADIILVGDSLGMLLYGMDSTLPVKLDMMISHGKAVVDSTKKSFVVVDMNFGSYQINPEIAFKNAAKIMTKTGAQAVKLEGGEVFKETVKFLVERGIPVLGHVGLTPQSVNQLGGYKVQGKDAKSKEQIVKDVLALEQAGCFAVVVEGVKQEVVKEIKKKTNIPLIGIGAANLCEGQVLVADDLLGITDKAPKFVKKYADLRGSISQAFKDYASEVKGGKFPGDEHVY